MTTRRRRRRTTRRPMQNASHWQKRRQGSLRTGSPTHDLNPEPAPQEQSSTALHPPYLSNGPTPRLGWCHALRRKHHRRYQGRFTRLASLARFLTAPAAAGLLPALAAPLVIMPAQAQGNAQSATCRVTFEGKWTTSVTTDGLPSGAHFSPLIGAVHNGSVTFWSSGGTAGGGDHLQAVAASGDTEATVADPVVVNLSITGPSDNRVDMVFVGDDYTEDEPDAHDRQPNCAGTGTERDPFRPHPLISSHRSSAPASRARPGRRKLHPWEPGGASFTRHGFFLPAAETEEGRVQAPRQGKSGQGRPVFNGGVFQ